MVRAFFRRLALLGAFFVLAGPLPAAGADKAAEAPQTRDEDREINSILASVNGEPILLSDVLPYTRAKEFQLNSTLSGAALLKAVRETRLEAVESLIDRRLLLAEYRKKPFDVLSTVVDQQVDEAAERFGCRSRREFTVRLRERGISIDDFRRDVEERLICQIMLFREAQVLQEVTPKELYEAYEKNAGRFQEEAQFDVALIQIKKDHPFRSEVLKEVASELAADPRNFDKLAGRVSDGPGAGDGGRIGRVNRSALRPEFLKALPEEPPSGSVYGPLECEDGTFFVRVLAVVPAQKRSLDEVREQLTKEIMESRRQKNREAYLKKLRSGAVVRYFF